MIPLSRAARLLVVGALAAAAACGGQPGRDSSAAPPAAGDRTGVPSRGSTAPGLSPRESVVASPVPGVVGAAGPTGSGGSGAQKGAPTVRLIIEIPSCVPRGSVARATIRSDPGALLGLAVAYDTNDKEASYQLGVAGPDGSFVWTWTVPTTVPPGRAQFLAAAGGVEDKQGATARKLFRVAEPGGC